MSCPERKVCSSSDELELRLIYVTDIRACLGGFELKNPAFPLSFCFASSSASTSFRITSLPVLV